MKKLHTGLATSVAALLVLALPRAPQAEDAAGAEPAVAVGTFDSRAVATAYVRSQAFSRYLREQRASVDAAIERARTAGDVRLVADLERLGPAMQKRVHQQGFGTAPVDDILATIQARLPAIADKAGVDVIVSKWSLTWRRPAAQLVDVTDALVAEFAPDAKTLEVIRQLVATDPVPLDQLRDH